MDTGKSQEDRSGGLWAGRRPRARASPSGAAPGQQGPGRASMDTRLTRLLPGLRAPERTPPAAPGPCSLGRTAAVSRLCPHHSGQEGGRRSSPVSGVFSNGNEMLLCFGGRLSFQPGWPDGSVGSMCAREGECCFKTSPQPPTSGALCSLKGPGHSARRAKERGRGWGGVPPSSSLPCDVGRGAPLSRGSWSDV